MFGNRKVNTKADYRYWETFKKKEYYTFFLLGKSSTN